MKYLTTKYMKLGDGAGSQIQRRLSIWAYCKLNNLEYVHTPFFKTEHNYEKDESFEANWEKFFNMSHDELKLGDVDSSHLSYVDSMNKYFDENSPDLYDSVRDEFRKKYFMTKKPKLVFDENVTNIAVHIRRGDLMTVHPKTRRRRFTSDEYFISVMTKLNEELSGNCKFYIYTQTPKIKGETQRQNNKTDGDLFANYRNSNMNIELIIDGCPFSDFHHLISADVLITSKSSFSFVPELFSTNRVVYNRFWHEPKSYWEIGGR
jgi:hypothetical protein